MSEAAFTNEPTPLVITHHGTVVFRLNRDGTVEMDWKRLESMRDKWSAGCSDRSIILAKAIWEVAQRVIAETESDFFIHH